MDVNGSAEPSVARIRRAMRRAYVEATREGGSRRGRQAREDMVAHYSRGAVADVVLQALADITSERPAGSSGSSSSSSTSGSGSSRGGLDGGAKDGPRGNVSPPSGWEDPGAGAQLEL